MLNILHILIFWASVFVVLTGGDPVAGAIGATVSEIAAESMDKPDATHEERHKIAQKARIIGDTVTFLAGRDVASADSAGKTAVENNYGGHPDEEAVPPVDVLLENSDKPLTEQLLTYTQASIEEGVKETQLWNETSTVMAPYAATGVVMGVGVGVPLVAKTAGVLGTIATAHYFGSIAVDSGAKGLVKEAKDHPILTVMAAMPFLPGPKVLKVTKISNAANKAPYNARAMESLLQKNNPGATVTSSTLPPASGPNVRVAGNALEKEIKLPSGGTKTISVPFDDRGLPIFDKHAVVETRISGDLSSMSGDAHKRMATRQLREDIKAGRVNKNLFTEGQLEDIQKGEKTIEGFIWHHDGSVKGRMQLVPEEIHEAIRHQGGNTMWRGGKK